MSRELEQRIRAHLEHVGSPVDKIDGWTRVAYAEAATVLRWAADELRAHGESARYAVHQLEYAAGVVDRDQTREVLNWPERRQQLLAQARRQPDALCTSPAVRIFVGGRDVDVKCQLAEHEGAHFADLPAGQLSWITLG